MRERELDISVDGEGTMKTFVYHPHHGGPHPVVLYLMDAPSIRPALQEMAMRLASAGYYVMLPYLYHRGSEYRLFTSSDEDMHDRQELMATVTPSSILPDAKALLDFAEADEAADALRFGAVGFCMSGGLVVSLARAMPERMVAGASIHGAWLVRDSDDSPHLGLESVCAELYFGWCADDPTAPIEEREILEHALQAADVRYTLDWFDSAQHGYAPPGGPRYDRHASEMHWERVHSLLQRHLQLGSAR